MLAPVFVDKNFAYCWLVADSSQRSFTRVTTDQQAC